ncbi:MAG: hypothetical protein ACYC1D_05450 [Acidimicrobiales bacterium]
MPETCPNGHPVAAGAAYCPHCGAALGDPTGVMPAPADQPDPTLVGGWPPASAAPGGPTPGAWGQQQGSGQPQEWGQQPPGAWEQQPGWGQQQPSGAWGQQQQEWGQQQEWDQQQGWGQQGAPPPPGAAQSRSKKTTGALVAVAALILVGAVVAVVVLVGFGTSAPVKANAVDWPASVRRSYLGTCERKQSISFCTCTFNYLQRNVPLSRYTSALNSGYLAQVEGPADAACQTNLGNGNGPSPGGGFNSGGSTFGS